MRLSSAESSAKAWRCNQRRRAARPKTITRLWKEWTKAENCDVTASQDFTEQLETILTRRIVDGGIFIVKVYTEDKRFPFKLQLRTVDELDTTSGTFGIESTNKKRDH
nr:phage portal protein [Paenibacillus melissococcoides]